MGNHLLLCMCCRAVGHPLRVQQPWSYIWHWLKNPFGFHFMHHNSLLYTENVLSKWASLQLEDTIKWDEDNTSINHRYNRLSYIEYHNMKRMLMCFLQVAAHAYSNDWFVHLIHFLCQPQTTLASDFSNKLAVSVQNSLNFSNLQASEL